MSDFLNGQLWVTLNVNTAALNKAAEAIKAFKNEVVKSVDGATKNIEVFDSSLNKTAISMQRFGYAASMYLTAPITLAARAAISAASEYEYVTKKVVALAGISQTQMNQWQNDIKRVSAETAKSQTELAESLYFIASAGVRGKEALEVMELSAKAAATGMGDAGTIARGVTSVINAYGEGVISAAQVTDVLTAAVREAHVPVETLTSQFGILVPTAAELGLSFAQLMGTMAALTRTGFNSGMAATSLRQIMVAMIKPTHGANVALKETGLSIEGLRKQMSEEGMLPVLKKINDAMKEHGDNVSAVFGNVRALSGVLSVIGPEWEKNLQIIEETTHAYGALEKAFSVMNKTMKFYLNDIKVAANSMWIDIGTSLQKELIPILQSLADMLRDIGATWRDLSETTKSWIIDISALVAALGPLLLLGAGLLKIWEGLKFAAQAVVVFFRSIIAGALEIIALVGELWLALLAIPGLAEILGVGILIGVFIDMAMPVKEATKAQEEWNAAVKRGADIVKDYPVITKKMQDVLPAMSVSNLQQTRNTYQGKIDDFEKNVRPQLDKAYTERVMNDERLTELYEGFQEQQTASMRLWYATNIAMRKEALEKEYMLEVGGWNKKIEGYKNYVQTIDFQIGDKKTKEIKAQQDKEYTDKIVKICESYYEKLANIQGRLHIVGNPLSGISDYYGLKVDSLEEQTKAAADLINTMAGDAAQTKTQRFIDLLKEYFSLVNQLRSRDAGISLAKDTKGTLMLSNQTSLQQQLINGGGYNSNTLGKDGEYTPFAGFVIPEAKGLSNLTSQNTTAKKALSDYRDIARLRRDLTRFGKGEEATAISQDMTKTFKQQKAALELMLVPIKQHQVEFEKINKQVQQYGQAALDFISNYSNLIEAKKQKEYAFIDEVAKREHKSAAWVTKEKLKLDEEYNKKKKSMAIAQALINGALAITNIWANTVDFSGIGLKIAFSALSAANTAMQIAAINSAGMATGGIVPSGYPNDTYPARLTSGEMVIPPGKLPNFMGAANSSTTIRLVGRLVADGKDMVYVLDEQYKVNQSY